MCQDHGRLVRKYKKLLDDFTAQVSGAATQSDITVLKGLKQKGLDDFNSLMECSQKEKYIKALNGPTPPLKNLPLFQNRLDELKNAFR